MIRYNVKTLLILTAIVGFLLSGLLFVQSAIQTRAIATVDHPNGTRIRVIQQFNYQPELFNTSIYFDDGDGKWRWYYFDHQDFYWGKANTEINGNKILVSAHARRIELDTLTGECTTIHSGRKQEHKKSDRIEPLPPTAGDRPDQQVDAG